MTRLIEKAREALGHFDIKKLEELGYKRDRKEYEFITTYPPQPALSPISQEDIFKRGARQREVQFYVHIPFCTGKCTYCNKYLTIANPQGANIGEYLDFLERERAIMDSIPELQRMRIGSLYVGGGTPTYLNEKELKRLTGFLVSQLDILEQAEFTVEASPETFTTGKAEVLLENRVNRLSIGIQSYNDDILNLCGRRHDGETAKLAPKLAAEAGFTNIQTSRM